MEETQQSVYVGRNRARHWNCNDCVRKCSITLDELKPYQPGVPVKCLYSGNPVRWLEGVSE